MAATNKTHLGTTAAKVYVAKATDAIPDLANDLSNYAAVATAIDALSLQRMASVTDIDFISSTSEQVKTETDDNGVIFSAYTPQSKVTGNWFEPNNPDALAELLGIKVVDVAAAGAEKAKKVFGENLTSKELPSLVVKLEGMADADGKKKTFYIVDAGLSGDLIFSFIDVVRNSGLKSSAFELIANKGGAWFCIQDQ